MDQGKLKEWVLLEDKKEEYDFLEDFSLTRKGVKHVKKSPHMFIVYMKMVAIKICKLQGWVTVDDLRAVAVKYKIHPKKTNVWGLVFSDSRWVVVGMRKSRVRSNRGRKISIWVWRSSVPKCIKI